MRNFAEINLYNIKENFRRCAAGRRAVAVVKADAYGHGAVRVAQSLEKDALAFAVSNVDEAEELIFCGISPPVVILGDGYPPEFDRALNCGAIVSVGNTENAVLLSEAARRKNIRARAVICVDTGMHRDGFSYDDIAGIGNVLGLKNVDVVGIYTHPFCADDAELVAVQKKRFERVKSALSGRRDMIFSFASSAAASERDDVPRIGISTYGLFSSGTEEHGLAPALSLSAKILSARRVKRGEYVGYGKNFCAEHDMTVATVAAGYGDGVPRALSNVGDVIINGGRATIVGNICMDMFMVCADGVRFEVGDTATLIGKNGHDEIRAEEVARLCGTVNYEIVCGISKRVPRIYRE